MTTYLPRYDELFSVSDIHMGGEQTERSNFQAFKYGDRLGRLIDHITALPGDREIALVLNGDIIDTLAESELGGYIALSSKLAVEIVDRIMADPSFAPVWQALGRFVNAEGRHLIFVLGNHDLELALPEVQHLIRERFREEGEPPPARITFATTGGGFGCLVGKARVFCSHGNEVDVMNWVDYTQLGGLANAMSAGRVVEAEKWQPNGGTRIVIDVMNQFKRRFPFVDLLKPEIKPVTSILLALDQDALSKVGLGNAWTIAKATAKGALVKRKILSDDDDIDAAPPEALDEAMLDELLGPNLRSAVANASSPAGDDLLDQIEEDIAAGRETSDAGGADGQTLGIFERLVRCIWGVEDQERLRLALKDWIGGDQSYDIEHEDSTFTEMRDRVGPDVDFLVTGHTHLARALPMSGSRGYFNSGTWMRLIRLTDVVLEDKDEFEKLYAVLSSARMQEIDDARIPSKDGPTPLVFDRTHTVHISDTGGEVVGQLIRVGDATGAVSLTPEPNAKFTV